MKNILTIGGGNGHSHILDLFYNKLKNNNLFCNFKISSIVSMSDDGRTTGLLMREMQDQLKIHLPPPGDLRRCLFSMSDSEFREEFHKLFETVILFDGDICDLTILQILEKIGEGKGFIKNLENHNKEFLDYKLPLKFNINGHKFGNLLMATLYYKFGDYNKMIEFMSFLLDVKANIIPVTTDKAFIKATLQNSQIIETQDHISNYPDYNGRIQKLELMLGSQNARLNTNVESSIKEADYIIITPGDLFTSIDANFIIPGFLECLKNSNAQKILILNSTNKKGETTDWSELDFIDFIQEKLQNKIDIIFGNDTEPVLNDELLMKFKNDISVKGGRYLIIDEKISKKIRNKYNNTRLITGKYINNNDLYRYNDQLIDDLMGIL